MRKYAYKVVDTDNLQSARSSLTPYGVQYKIGEFVTPKFPGTRLFVFRDLASAQKFRDRNESIFKCEVKNPRPMTVMAFGHKDIKPFWSASPWKRRFLKDNIETPPPGTLSCNAVKLLEKVS